MSLLALLNHQRVDRRILEDGNKRVNTICALPGCYATLGGSSVSTFRDNPSVPSLRAKKSKRANEFLYTLPGVIINIYLHLTPYKSFNTSRQIVDSLTSCVQVLSHEIATLLAHMYSCD
jgi:hypothetical protein